MSSNLANKTALVTGASRGIGHAIALKLAQLGARVIAHYGSGEAEANALVREIRDRGGRADAVQADLAKADGPHQLAATTHKLLGVDKLDALVANAGVIHAATVEEQTVDDFDRLVAINVRAPYFLVQQCLPFFAPQASVVFMSSIGARMSVGDRSVYGMTKGAIAVLTQKLAGALGSRGIRVNAIAPGVIATSMSDFVFTDAGRDFALGIQALKRIGQPDDIADVVSFLVSEEARWITGASIYADGGTRL
jgi:3-oxoacyl-[acyl-carrier protein] reductase